MSESTGNDASARQELASKLAERNFAVHQVTDPILFTRVPKPAMAPCHWRSGEIAFWLDEIGRSVKLEAGGVRRTLRLTNPGLEWGTTPTFWASIQYILPGEIATAHRHTASALRFIMEGEGANTIVEGESYPFEVGDLVLTPKWTFHDHEHSGTAPMIWLDVLDVSLVRNLDAVFFDPHDRPRSQINVHPQRSMLEYGSGLMRPRRALPDPSVNPLLVYSRGAARKAVLDAASLPPDPYYDTAMEYLNPATGGPAMPTIGTMLQRLRPGSALRPFRQTGSSVYYIIEGSGRSQIDGQVFTWGAGDFIAIPSWARQQHCNASETDDAWLFQVNDFPALKALNLWREELE